MQKDFSLKKKERLYHKKLIDELFKNGKSFVAFPFRIQYLFMKREEDDAKAQILISIPKKRVKKAVGRNLLKRRVREVYRQNKYKLVDLIDDDIKLVFSFIYITNDIVDYNKCNSSFEKVVKRMKNIIEKESKNDEKTD